MSKPTSKDIAREIAMACQRLGWKYEVRGNIFTITKEFTPNSKEEFSKADSEYSYILGFLPTTSPGSVWGTDGGGVGALSAMKSGVFRMNKSGGSKRVMSALDKLV